MHFTQQVKVFVDTFRYSHDTLCVYCLLYCLYQAWRMQEEKLFVKEKILLDIASNWRSVVVHVTEENSTGRGPQWHSG